MLEEVTRNVKGEFCEGKFPEKACKESWKGLKKIKEF
jgi:hypothetical protein